MTAKEAVLAAAHERWLRITPDANGKRPKERKPRAMSMPHGGVRIVGAFGVHEGPTAKKAWEEAAKSVDGFNLVAAEAFKAGRDDYRREIEAEIKREMKRHTSEDDYTYGRLGECRELLEWIEGKEKEE